MVFDRADQPERVEFYQLKSQGKGEWSLKAMLAKKGKQKPATFLGRLHHHTAAFGKTVGRLGFVSNISFKLKLADGTETGPDHLAVHSHELHASEIAILKKAVANDAAMPIVFDGSGLFVFERTSLGISDQDKFVKGCLVDFFHDHGGAEHVPVIALYYALQGSVFKKIGVTQEFTTEAEFYDRKTLCRADIEAMFSRAIAGRRFLESWHLVERDLAAVGMSTRQIIALHSSCIRYIRGRSAGEPGAAAFNAAVLHAIVDKQAEVDGCGSVTEIIAFLEVLVQSDYENRSGGFCVEAFEAMK